MAFRWVTFAVPLALALLAACSQDATDPAAAPTSSSGPPSTVASTLAPRPQPETAASSAHERPDQPALEPMNVILLVVDALRDDMPWNGYKRDIAPNLTKLHDQSVSYERGYAVSSFTAKSVPALLTGQYPSSLARTTGFFTTYRQRNQFLAEVAHEQGVRTLGVQAHMYFKDAAGFHQGFDEWQIVPNIEWDLDKDPYITGADQARMVIEQLSKPENTTGRFFAYYHFMDPHHTYNTHDGAPHFGNKARDRYDEEVWFTDQQLKKVFDFVGQQPWGQHTAVILTADHGEAFGEHDLLKHAYELYEVLVRVPLFISIPGVQPRRIPRWRSHVDLAPTIYDLLGIKKPDGLPGTSLVPEILGSAPAPQRPIVCDLPADVLNVRHRVLIDEQGYKLIAFGRDVRYELYNVREDPEEKLDLLKRDKGRTETLIKRYKEVSKAIPFLKAQGGRPVKPD